MGWTPAQLRETSLPDFAAAVAAWNGIQSGDAPEGGEPPPPDVVAAKIRSSLGRRRANG